jgi:hypothetical protein
MECEENLVAEQIKCREVVKARVEGLENELKQAKHSEHLKHSQVKDRDSKIFELETDIKVERDLS